MACHGSIDVSGLSDVWLSSIADAEETGISGDAVNNDFVTEGDPFAGMEVILRRREWARDYYRFTGI